MSKPLCIDLFCGLGGWTEGFLAEGWDVIGFDIEQHVYGEHRYPAQLVLQDVLTLHGRQLKDARCIVASSPCQAYSYMAMPWTRAKQIARALRGQDEFPEKYEGYRTIEALNSLFEAPKRIQREACEAAGRFIPMIQENVRGAIPWVGRSQWNFGSYHLWGDVPALMPITLGRKVMKSGVAHRTNGETNFHHSAARAVDGVKAGDRCKNRETGAWTTGWNVQNVRDMKAEDEGLKNPGFRFDGSGRSMQTESTKNTGGSWFNIGSPGQKETNNNPVTQNRLEVDEDAGTKQGGDWFSDPLSHSRQSSSKSSARKAASARIAKIPFPLASHMARVYYPREVTNNV
jgi:hypothetical protein